MTPKRIRLRRTKGWRLPPGTINIARPSKLGNMIRVTGTVQVSAEGADGLWYQHTIPMTPAIAVAMYEAVWTAKLEQPAVDAHPDDIEDWRGYVALMESVRGHDVACYCALTACCHGDSVIKLANR